MYKYHSDEIELVAVNDLSTAPANAHLFKWDSTYGRFEGDVESTDDSIIINGKKIHTFSEKDPNNIPWGEYGVDVVIESTGVFTDGTKAVAHINSGAKKVIISAPGKNVDGTFVMGVNNKDYDPAKDKIISNASCTTNGLAPICKVLNDKFGIVKGMMTTVHSYTNDQKLQDVTHKDPRRARAACSNIIPTSTGAAKAIGLVIPELEGKLHGVSLRVPTTTVSAIDLVAELKCDVTKEQINEAFKEASLTYLKGYLEYCDEPLVSMDFKGNAYSSIVDSLSTMVIGGNMVKILAWYDNEWGYSTRLSDLIAYIGSFGF
jgi:glyceraldehyde 3-phosphate dehydrogenase